MTKYPWLAIRGRTFYLRAPVPLDIQKTFGKAEIWKSLRTRERKIALDRLRTESASLVASFLKHRLAQARLTEPPLDELSEAHLKAVEDAYFVHLLDEDDDTRESGFESRDFDNDADWLEALDEINRAEFARGQLSDFMMDEAREVLSWDNVGLRLADGSPSWPKVVRAVYKATIRANEIKKQRNTGAVIDTPSAPAAPPQAAPKPTLQDAVDFYVKERISGSDFAQRKRKVRIEAMMGDIKAALKTVPALTDWTIDDAYKLRDFLLDKPNSQGEKRKPSTVRRELNDVKGIFSLYRDKKLRSMDNPFDRLELPKDLEVNIDKEDRDPLPEAVMTATRDIIIKKANPDLKLIWRLLEGTGCRLAEITGLRVQDIQTDGETPHLKIISHEGRRLKNASSRRDVPLVGDALMAAKAALKLADEGLFAFLRYSGDAGPNSASASLMKRLREVSSNPLHTVHSLRHNMADRCDLTGVHPTDKAAILGHLNAGASEKHYGSTAVKLVTLTRAMTKAFGPSTCWK